jgi:hypothetical protein
MDRHVSCPPYTRCRADIAVEKLIISEQADLMQNRYKVNSSTEYKKRESISNFAGPIS